MGKTKIYTRAGDLGQTSIIGGKRVCKSSAQLEAYGTLDELNSHLGLLHSFIKPQICNPQFIEGIQRCLFQIGTILATDPSSAQLKPQQLNPAFVEQLEQEIDRLDATLPPLNSFILPAGSPASCQAQVCRTVCRRAERRIVQLAQEVPFDSILLCYINRLSDYLFILSRALNFFEDYVEIKI